MDQNIKQITWGLAIICIIGIGIASLQFILPGILVSRAQKMQVAYPTIVPTQIILKQITQDEVTKHANLRDCWIIIKGKVYNATQFFSQYTVKNAESYCGKDQTQMVQELLSKSPMYGTMIDQGLQKYAIGTIK